jgi:phenylalanyl-tRNA synthetase beta chain
MRQTLLFSGLESISHNLNRRMADLKFYEFGNVYKYNSSQAESNDVTRKYSEIKKISIYITGNQQSESWYMPDRKTDYHFMKSLVFALLRKTGVGLHKLLSAEVDSRLFAEGEAFSINNKPLVSMGRLSAGLLKQFDVKQDVFYAEIDWSTLLRQVQPDGVKFSDISRFPEVRRDLALLLDRDIKFTDIETLAYKNGKGILRAVNLFDVYEGDKIEAGKKSYAVSFTMQDDQKTLTDADIEKLMKRLAEVFEKELGAVIRK